MHGSKKRRIYLFPLFLLLDAYKSTVNCVRRHYIMLSSVITVKSIYVKAVTWSFTLTVRFICEIFMKVKWVAGNYYHMNLLTNKVENLLHGVQMYFCVLKYFLPNSKFVFRSSSPSFLSCCLLELSKSWNLSSHSRIVALYHCYEGWYMQLLYFLFIRW